MFKFFTILFVVAAVVFAWILFRSQPAQAPQSVQQPPLTVTTPSTPETTVPSETPSSETQPSSDIPQESSVPPIVLEEPVSGATVTSPFVVKGTASTFEKVTVRILNKDGKELISESVNHFGTADKNAFRSFKVTLSYEFKNTREGFLEISIPDAAYEGMDSLKIPLKFE